MTDVMKNIAASADTLRAEAEASDALGKLTDTTARLIKESGIMRMLQPKEWGGFESHPSDFLEAAMEMGHHQPSAGWVSGVVGLHPWELGQFDPRLCEELWAEDPDTWVASPYAPFGRAIPVDGGYQLSGRWTYSSGTDHCQWVVIGGMVADEAGNPLQPPQVRHFVIPRGDYEIVEDSWNTLGLRGTGSKDLILKDVFVPDYRTVSSPDMNELKYAYRQEGKPLYRINFPVMFSAGIGAATQGVAQGALMVYREYLERRVDAFSGSAAKKEPSFLLLYGEAASDIAASRSHLLTSMSEVYDYLSKGGELTWSQRLTFRRDQVRASRRAVDAIDRLYKSAGAASIHRSLPNERYWRDSQTALVHICNVAENIYQLWALDDLGDEEPQFAFV
ncbi:hydroxylase [Nocardioides sp. cx-169]|uniref:hydroxylase n=1 Tax=Nocardioides sp. cx-169 TaxID=2899080 RepID=UPI001E3E23CC|nr:hydroxylase [Nocardioides sp. cx-169]MCD4534294.1 hydroxylase [Nocardioides sp. cx-169]